jgi:hypothetical protein
MGGLVTPDVVGFYRVLGVELASGHGEWIPLSCITHAGEHAHEDRNKSAAIHSESGVHRCHVHGNTSPYDIALSRLGDKRRAMEQLVRHGLREARSDDSLTGHRRVVTTYDYTNEDGEPLYQVVRFDPKDFRQRRLRINDTCGCPRCKQATDGDWIWNMHKTRRVIYRLPQVKAAVAAGRRVWIPEGEKDVQALEALGEVATTNPMGASNWRPEYVDAFEGATAIVIADSDDPGRRHAREVAASLRKVAESVTLVEAPNGHKDISDHLDAGGNLDELLPLPESAERTERSSGNPVNEGDSAFGGGPNGDRTPTERPEPPLLASEPDILACLDDKMRSAGLVGEEHIARAVYLVHVSRLLAKPGRVVVKGDSATGKSYAVECALKAADPDSLWTRTSTSPLALFYSEESFEHRTLTIYEANKLGDDDDPLARVLRTLLSEGRLAYEVTDAKRRTTELLEKDGPVAFISTVARASLDKEIETRILSLHSNGSDEQTQKVVEALLRAAADTTPEPDFSEWHVLDQWLKTGPSEVVLPWGPALAEFNLSGPPRLRRDITNLLSLAKAHALLHQATRGTDPQGRIVATLDDYEVVRGLLSEALAIATDKTVRSGTREVVEAVKAMREERTTDERKAPISLRAAARKAGRSPSTTQTDVHDALDRGYLINRSNNDRSHDLDVGDPLPGKAELLPTREELEEQVNHSVAVRPAFAREPNGKSPVETRDWAGRSVRSADLALEVGPAVDEDMDTDVFDDTSQPDLAEQAFAWLERRGQ